MRASLPVVVEKMVPAVVASLKDNLWISSLLRGAVLDTERTLCQPESRDLDGTKKVAQCPVSAPPLVNIAFVGLYIL